MSSPQAHAHSAPRAPAAELRWWGLDRLCVALRRLPTGRGLALIERLMLADASAHAADLRLVRSALGGRRGAAHRLVERLACIPAMVRSKNARLGEPLDRDELEEAVQNTFASVWGKLEAFEGRSALETWVFGFCANEVFKGIHRKRRERLMAEAAEEDLPAADDPGLAAADREYAYLYAGLERLGPPAADVIRLKHFEQLTFDQIGERMAISPNTAKTHYYRGVRRLEASLRSVWRAEQP